MTETTSPASGSARQKAYRQRRATKSVDISAGTHELLRRLCDRDGLNVDEALRKALEGALAQSAADRDVAEAAWGYLSAAQAGYEEFEQHGYITVAKADSVQASVTAFETAVRTSGKLSQKAYKRVDWMTKQGVARVKYVETRSEPVEPLAANARNGGVGTVAQTLLAGGDGISLNNAALVLAPHEDGQGEQVARVRISDR